MFLKLWPADIHFCFPKKLSVPWLLQSISTLAWFPRGAVFSSLGWQISSSLLSLISLFSILPGHCLIIILHVCWRWLVLPFLGFILPFAQQPFVELVHWSGPAKLFLHSHSSVYHRESMLSVLRAWARPSHAIISGLVGGKAKAKEWKQESGLPLTAPWTVL